MRRDSYREQSQNRGTGSQRGNYGDEPRNFGSARSDYGDQAYGRLSQRGTDRGWWDRASDEVSSWMGDEQAERRRRMDERRQSARGRGYDRQDYDRRDFERRDQGSGTASYGYYPIEPDPAFEVMSSKEYVDRRDWHHLRARDVMTTNVSTVFPNDSVQFAARLMRDEDCGALPVVDRYGRMIGMITDRDITVRLVADGYDLNDATVSDCMTDEVFACHISDSLETCMRAMSRHQIRRLAVVDDRNRVAGIISQGDLALHAESNQGPGERRALADMVGNISEPTDEPYR